MSTADQSQPAVSRGLLIALGAVLGVALLVALWFFVVAPLFAEEPLADAPPPGDAEVAEEPDVADDEDEDALDLEDGPPPETDEVFSARDPFQQLVEPASATAAVDSGDAEDADSEDGDGEEDGDDDGDDDGDGAAPGVRVGETSVRLVEVVVGDDGVTRVVVEVNGEQHEAAEEETFAERFRVLDISGDCATFLFGDNRFTLCQGESIRK